MVRPISQKVYDAVMMDSAAMLSPACLLDFGLDLCSDEEFTARFGALQSAARGGATPEDFDNALGEGVKLTALVAQYGSTVEFPKTAWDLFAEADEG